MSSEISLGKFTTLADTDNIAWAYGPTLLMACIPSTVSVLFVYDCVVCCCRPAAHGHNVNARREIAEDRVDVE